MRYNSDKQHIETTLTCIGAKFGLAVMTVWLLMLATAATGGGALALASGGVAAATAIANATVAAGAATVSGSLVMQFAKESKKSGKERATVGW